MAVARRVFLVSGLAFAMPSRALKADEVNIERRYIDGRFGQIHVRTARPANPAKETQPPLACLHYSPGSGRTFEPLFPHLATDRLVMAFDTPGYGLSDPPPIQPSIPDYAEALLSAIDGVAEGRKVDLFGRMTGSLIAVEMAVSHSDLIRKVVLSRTPVFAPETRDYGIAEMLRRHEDRKQDKKAQYLVDRLKRGLERLGPNDPPERYIGTYIDTVLPGHNWVYGEVAAFSYRADITMPKMTQPVLFVTWIEDENAEDGPFGSLREWTRGADIIPNVRRLNLTDLGNWPWQEQAEVIAGHVRGFLDQST